ncbi:hypothetical protein C7H81_17805 [Bacillus subtilis]|nr:hypothetical protein CVV77_17080 [Bacillus sp. SN1]PSI03611.1 hypothetical protein C7H81_17805 [Bacillus subtilis]
MYNQLREIVNLLEKINSYGQTNILSVEFEEQQDNLNDLSLLLTDMDKLKRRVNILILNMFKMLIDF